MLSILRFEEKEVRVDVDENGEPLFCASDVARCLGYARPNEAVTDHCKGGTPKRRIIDSLGRAQEANFIKEPDVYRLIFGSKLPGAQKFMDWIVEEVIPSIRKTGGYGSNVPKTYSEALLEAGRLEAEKEKLLKEVEQSNSKIKKLTPYAEVGKAFAEREGSCKIGQFCKCIRIDGRVMGQNKMFEFMREIGFLSPSPRNEPYQYHVDAGRAYLAQGEHPENGRMVPHFTPMLTVKGQCYLVTRMQDHPSFIENSIVVSSKILNIVPED